jgi:DNA-binding Xre family transcriptional regulator
MMNVYPEEEAIGIERELAELLDELREEKKISRIEWGKIAFADAVANTQGKIQDIVGKRGNRKPKRLSVGDFLKLCQALDLEPSQLLAAVLLKHRK